MAVSQAMVICPDCLVPLPDLGVEACGACGWRLERRDGVPVLLSSRDRADPLFARYLENYEVIAQDDLAETIQRRAYLEVGAAGLMDAAGDVSGASVCDVGFGQGDLLELMRAAGARALTAVDIARPYFDAASVHHDVRFVQANGERLPFEDEFDVVVASAVLEHVLNAGDFLLSAHRALVPGGRLVVKVPYRESIVSYARQAGCEYDFVHLRSFDRPILKTYLESAGFAVERFAYDGWVPERLRHAWTARERPQRILRGLLERYPDHDRIARMDPRLGRVFFVPNEITAVARAVV